MRPARARIVLVLLAALAVASTPVVAWGQGRDAAKAERRLALIIGNARYPTSPLRNPVNDARAMGKSLHAAGFEVLVRENLSQKEMRRAIIDFGEKLRVGDVALFYFAGHGLQVAGRNYMVPVDAEIASEVEVEVESVDVATVLVRMETVRTRVNIVILDACRDNPFAHRFKPSVRGLASIDAPAGTLIAYATAPGKVARDGAAGGNGLYTGELVKAIGAPGLRIEDVFKRVRQAVQREAQGEQVPWESSSLVGNFTFVPSKAAASTKTARPAQGSSRLEVREEHREVGTLALTSRIPGVEVWVDEQRVGTMREGAALIVDNLSAGAHRIRAKKDGRRDWAREVKIVAGQRTEVSVDPAPAAASAVPRPDDAGAQVLVAAGEFMMGSTREEVEQAVEQCRALGRQAVTCRRLHENELPRRPVTLDAFHIDRDEVTNARFERFVASTDYRTRAEQQGWSTVYRDIDGKWLGERVAGAAWQTPRGAGSAAEPAHPVVHVSWSEADTYCRWVGRRLPSEAEWEKAARGPTPRSFPWGDVWSGSRANARRATAAGGTVPVGQNQEGASPYGVRDMAGNVWEWVADWLDTQYYRRAPDRNPPGPERGEQRVKRGGAWDSSAVNVRTMRRGSADPTTHDNMTGFRCARSAS